MQGGSSATCLETGFLTFIQGLPLPPQETGFLTFIQETGFLCLPEQEEGRRPFLLHLLPPKGGSAPLWTPSRLALRSTPGAGSKPSAPMRGRPMARAFRDGCAVPGQGGDTLGSRDGAAELRSTAKSIPPWTPWV